MKFLAPAVGFLAAFMSIPVWGLFTGSTTTAFSVTSTLSVVSIAVSALLALRGAAVAEDAGEILA